jgi:hypothetical protein
MARRRFESKFDPEDLARITHRGLKPTSKKEKPSVTHQSLESLKTVAKNEDTAEVTAKRWFHRIFGSLSSFFSGLCAGPQRKVGQCENYGHVLKSGWQGDFPICADCGAKITDIAQVRSANLKNEKKPDDPYNSGRKYVT